MKPGSEDFLLKTSKLRKKTDFAWQEMKPGRLPIGRVIRMH